ncbi:MAG: hypothetical protein ABSF89_17625 [Acidimicrobiales bacterium]|jgi:hypothetical protein
MILIEQPQQATSDLPDAEALIKEARSHQRKRWLTVLTVVLAFALGIGLAVSASSGGRGNKPTAKPTASTSPLSPGGILRLANKGLSGDFEATYKLSGKLALFPGPIWTVVVAHKGPSVVKSVWMLGSGEWSFLLRAGNGYELQWIEHANRYEACWLQAGAEWRCGKGTVYASNGFALFTMPYVPATVDGDIRASAMDSYPMGHGEHQRLTVASKSSAKFGKLDCLTTTTWFTSKRTGTARTDISAVTWCLTARGLSASEYQRGNPPLASPWADLTLVSTRPVAPQADFQPKSPTAVRNGLPGL